MTGVGCHPLIFSSGCAGKLQGRNYIVGSSAPHSALAGAKKPLAGITGDEGQFSFLLLVVVGSLSCGREAGDVRLGLWSDDSSFRTRKLYRLRLRNHQRVT
jgi:hypothetical protein